MNNANEKIVIIDYGMGNIGSISNMLKYLGNKASLSNNINEIAEASKLILPGVGHFDKAMNNINNLGITEVIREKALNDKTPLLGICLGMQLMCRSSEEGTQQGLGLLEAEVKRFVFPEEQKMKVPHMGWNEIQVNKPSRILTNLEEAARFYFVHSYFVTCDKQEDVLTYTHFGIPFVSSFEIDNIIGVQYHPEKSHKFGINLFKNFLDLY